MWLCMDRWTDTQRHTDGWTDLTEANPKTGAGTTWRGPSRCLGSFFFFSSLAQITIAVPDNLLAHFQCTEINATGTERQYHIPPSTKRYPQYTEDHSCPGNGSPIPGLTSSHMTTQATTITTVITSAVQEEMVNNKSIKQKFWLPNSNPRQAIHYLQLGSVAQVRGRKVQMAKQQVFFFLFVRVLRMRTMDSHHNRVDQPHC